MMLPELLPRRDHLQFLKHQAVQYFNLKHRPYNENAINFAGKIVINIGYVLFLKLRLRQCKKEVRSTIQVIQALKSSLRQS